MTGEPERIRVPTNGKGPHQIDDPPPESSSPGELTVAFTPIQIAVGFGIVASLVLLAARQFRRGRRGRRGRR